MNFDERLRMSMTREQYRLAKSKGGRSGSSAGQPRPYAKQNMFKAQLFSPRRIGSTILVSPKHTYLRFRVGHLYEWHVYDSGRGTIDGVEVSAEEIWEHFIVKKGKK